MLILLLFFLILLLNYYYILGQNKQDEQISIVKLLQFVIARF